MCSSTMKSANYQIWMYTVGQRMCLFKKARVVPSKEVPKWGQDYYITACAVVPAAVYKQWA